MRVLGKALNSILPVGLEGWSRVGFLEEVTSIQDLTPSRVNQVKMVGHRECFTEIQRSSWGREEAGCWKLQISSLAGALEGQS